MGEGVQRSSSEKLIKWHSLKKSPLSIPEELCRRCAENEYTPPASHWPLH